MCELPPARHHGEYPIESLPSGWDNAQVFFRSRNGVDERRRIEILDLETNERYPQEPLVMIAFKCLGLFLFVNTAYFVFYTIVQFARLFIVPVVNLSRLAFFKEAQQVVKIPFFYIEMQFAALYGVFKPLEGRAYFAKLESDLHWGKTRKEAEQYRKEEHSIFELAKDAFCNEDPETALFVAFCMQPLGRVDDPHIIRFERIQNLQAV